MSTGPSENSLNPASACEDGGGASPFEGSCARATTPQPTTSADSSQDATRFLMQKPAVSGGVRKAVSANFILIFLSMPSLYWLSQSFSDARVQQWIAGRVSFILVVEFLRTRSKSSLRKEYTNRSGEERGTRCGSNIAPI